MPGGDSPIELVYEVVVVDHPRDHPTRRVSSERSGLMRYLRDPANQHDLCSRHRRSPSREKTAVSWFASGGLPPMVGRPPGRPTLCLENVGWPGQALVDGALAADAWRGSVKPRGLALNGDGNSSGYGCESDIALVEFVADALATAGSRSRKPRSQPTRRRCGTKIGDSALGPRPVLVCPFAAPAGGRERVARRSPPPDRAAPKVPGAPGSGPISVDGEICRERSRSSVLPRRQRLRLAAAQRRERGILHPHCLLYVWRRSPWFDGALGGGWTVRRIYLRLQWQKARQPRSARTRSSRSVS